MSSFEDARHQGYSAAEMAADMAEVASRMQALGCYGCKYSSLYHATCEGIINGELAKCPYIKPIGGTV